MYAEDLVQYFIDGREPTDDELPSVYALKYAEVDLRPLRTEGMEYDAYLEREREWWAYHSRVLARAEAKEAKPAPAAPRQDGESERMVTCCVCNARIPARAAMSASLGTACPSCYDEASLV